MLSEIKRVVFIGAGNVAFHLAKNLYDQEIEILGIYARTLHKSKEIAQLVSADLYESLEEIPACDLVLVCVNDDQISAVLEKLPPGQAIAYTSGTVQLTDLPKRDKMGVFYPLQSFSKARSLDLFQVPFLIEANTTEFAQKLFELAWKLSPKVSFASSEDRKKYHLAAVFVNNFANHLSCIADEILQKDQLDFNLLLPLMEESVSKLKTLSPLAAQTGPARRKDFKTIEMQKAALEGNSLKIYEILTKSILDKY